MSKVGSLAMRCSMKRTFCKAHHHSYKQPILKRYDHSFWPSRDQGGGGGAAWLPRSCVPMSESCGSSTIRLKQLWTLALRLCWTLSLCFASRLTLMQPEKVRTAHGCHPRQILLTTPPMTHQALIADIRVMRHFHLPRSLHQTQANYAVKDLDRAHRCRTPNQCTGTMGPAQTGESIALPTADQVNRILLQTVAELYPPITRQNRSKP